MKSNTPIVLGINNVGDSKDAPEIFSGTFAESILHLARWISTRSIASRIDIVIGRTEEEVRNGLRIRENTKETIVNEANLMSELTSLLGKETES